MLDRVDKNLTNHLLKNQFEKIKKGRWNNLMNYIFISY